LAAVLIGSLMASHTLLGFPIVRRMKLVTDEAVAVTIGGTVFTDFSSLLILAVCLPIHKSGFSASAFAVQIVEMMAYVLVVFVGLSGLGRWLMDRMGAPRKGGGLVAPGSLLAPLRFWSSPLRSWRSKGCLR
jgi:Kef-type K+ transport system membrane component KefB